MSLAKLPAGVVGVVSNASGFSSGTDTVNDHTFMTNSLTRLAINGTTGTFTQDSTNGGNLIWTKTSTAIAQAPGWSISAAGAIRTTATALVAVFNEVTVVGAGQGVALWDCPIGATLRVVNIGANTLTVYPQDGASAINSNGVGVGASLLANTQADFVRITATNWRAYRSTITVL